MADSLRWLREEIEAIKMENGVPANDLVGVCVRHRTILDFTREDERFCPKCRAERPVDSRPNDPPPPS